MDDGSGSGSGSDSEDSRSSDFDWMPLSLWYGFFANWVIFSKGDLFDVPLLIIYRFSKGAHPENVKL